MTTQSIGRFGIAIALLVALGIGAAPPAVAALPAGSFLSAMSGGNTVGASIRETTPRADGFRHLNTPATIAKLQAMRVTTYTFGIWESPTDWDDLRNEFAAAAKAAGIEIMVYVVPPSECFLAAERHRDGRCSRPFNKDYVAWAEAIAQLSLQHTNLTSWAIDDFFSGSNPSLFTKAYIDQVRAAQNAVNPNLEWYVTAYAGELSPGNLTSIRDSLDGVIYPFLGYSNSTRDATWLDFRVNEMLTKLQGTGLDLVFLLYAGRFLDAIVSPDETYVADALRRIRPYVEGGRVKGIIAYAAPMQLDKHEPMYNYLARTGAGRLSFSSGNYTSTTDGSYAEASQIVSFTPGTPKSLAFHHFDQYVAGLTGYQFKQVLVNDRVVWESDLSVDAEEAWIPTTLDLTSAFGTASTSGKLTIRLLHRKGIGHWPTDVSFDDFTATGFTLQNGGFDTLAGWQLTQNHSGIQPLIDLFAADRPTRIFNAVGAAYATFRGQTYSPVTGGSWPTLRITRENRSMYGDGRLSLSMPAGIGAAAGSCARAEQVVAVTPGLPRYELLFWDADFYEVSLSSYQFKKITIDGQELWKRDTGDGWKWDYLHGSDHQGQIDVTDFVRGKTSVRLSLQLCHDKAVSDFPNELSFDNLETVGLDVKNADFESTANWTLTADGSMRARIAIAP